MGPKTEPEAGRELDRRAHKTIGGQLCMCSNPGCDLRGDGDYGPAPHYSTEWGPAGEVVEKMCPRYTISLHETHPGGGVYVAHFTDSNINKYWGNGQTAPEAICRAALAACGVSAGCGEEGP